VQVLFQGAICVELVVVTQQSWSSSVQRPVEVLHVHLPGPNGCAPATAMLYLSPLTNDVVALKLPAARHRTKKYAAHTSHGLVNMFDLLGNGAGWLVVQKQD
jgi:hypothetical protein